MTNFKNMKIEINEEQPLDDVVIELERLGYIADTWSSDCNFIYSNEDGSYDCFYGNHPEFHEETTLAELKEM